MFVISKCCLITALFGYLVHLHANPSQDMLPHSLTTCNVGIDAVMIITTIAPSHLRVFALVVSIVRWTAPPYLLLGYVPFGHLTAYGCAIAAGTAAAFKIEYGLRQEALRMHTHQVPTHRIIGHIESTQSTEPPVA